MLIVAPCIYPNDLLVLKPERDKELKFDQGSINVSSLTISAEGASKIKQLISITAHRPDKSAELLKLKRHIYAHIPIGWLDSKICLQMFGSEKNFFYQATYLIPSVLNKGYEIGLEVNSERYQESIYRNDESIGMILYKGACGHANHPFETSLASFQPLSNTNSIHVLANTLGGHMSYNWHGLGEEPSCKGNTAMKTIFSAKCTIPFAVLNAKYEHTDLMLIISRDETTKKEFVNLRVHHGFIIH